MRYDRIHDQMGSLKPRKLFKVLPAGILLLVYTVSLDAGLG